MAHSGTRVGVSDSDGVEWRRRRSELAVMSERAQCLMRRSTGTKTLRAQSVSPVDSNVDLSPRTLLSRAGLSHGTVARLLNLHTRFQQHWLRQCDDVITALTEVPVRTTYLLRYILNPRWSSADLCCTPHQLLFSSLFFLHALLPPLA